MSEYIDRLVEDEAPWFPPTCGESPGECDWSQEQAGHEEQAVTVMVCLTHGTEVWPGDRKREEP